MGIIEFVMSDSIRRHLETILDEGNPPADENHDPQGRILVLEVSYQAIVMKMLETVSKAIVCMGSFLRREYASY